MTSTTPPPTKQLTLPHHTRSLFRSRLCSAVRTALACTIVGATTIYTPAALQHHLKFPAFSYVVAVLISSGDSATLGDTLRGAALAVYKTVLGLLPAMLTLYMIRPEGISAATSSVAAAVSAFVVVVSDSTGVVTKRIALGQIVLVYVAAFDFKKGHARPVLHPVPVAASTAVGVAAAVLALVLPYPRLACYEVNEKSKLYSEIAIERLRLFLNAFCADNSSCMAASISQAKSLGRACTKLLQKIKVLQGTMQWERPPLKFLPPYNRSPSNRLQAIETSLKGMEMALSSTTSLPKITRHQHLRDDVLGLHDQMSIKIRADNSKSQNDDYTLDTTLRSLHHDIIPQNLQELPPFFFLFCMKLLHVGTLAEHNANSSKSKDQEENSISKKRIWAMNLSTKKVVIALKCSLTLGLAIFLGLLFSKDDGYWSGLTVAITFTPSREATFRLASLRAHGTALGSIYGVLGSLVSQNLMEVRLLLLIPWIVFTSFLQRSKMYGQAGAISAVLSAMIIMGRRNYGFPIMFTINRLTETYIGLFCTVIVELLLQPTRATSMARGQLLKSFRTLHQCIESVTSLEELKENEKKLRKRVNELKKYIVEAELEPNLWFLPLPIACYNKLYNSLANMGDLLLFLVHGMEILIQESIEIEETLEDLDKFKELVGASLKCLEEVIQVQSLERLAKELKRKVSCDYKYDIEIGKCQSPCSNWSLGVDDECDKIIACFLEHSKEVVERVNEDVGGELRSKLVLCFATIGFCMGGLRREMREVEKGIVLEFVQWENPSSHINLYEISCKIEQLAT